MVTESQYHSQEVSLQVGYPIAADHSQSLLASRSHCMPAGQSQKVIPLGHTIVDYCQPVIVQS